MTQNNTSNSHSHGPLGEQVEYPSHYSPGLLHGIPRAPGRAALNTQVAMYGADIWNAYEVSWLNLKGKPEVACVAFTVPADSPNIVESKSLKLYLNSFNQHRLSGEKAFIEQISADLHAVIGVPIGVDVYRPDRWGELSVSAAPSGQCLDSLDVSPGGYTPDATLLKVVGENDENREQSYYSHLLRSRCPVTGQPDWATVEVRCTGPALVPESLLLYLISFREHDDFHEHCVERIYSDLQRVLGSTSLTVSARYLRRGGLDINPWRSSDPTKIPTNLRLYRQ